MSEKRHLTYDAPVLPFDYEPDGDPIWPCVDCLPWHVEVVITPEEGVLIREWHAVDCQVFDEDESEVD